jgi:hypothetical protein
VFYRCIPTFNVNATSAALGLLNSPANLFNQALGAIQESWYARVRVRLELFDFFFLTHARRPRWVILAMTGAALVLSFIWICLMRCCAGCMVWSSIIFVFVSALALDALLWLIGASHPHPSRCAGRGG